MELWPGCAPWFSVLPEPSLSRSPFTCLGWTQLFTPFFSSLSNPPFPWRNKAKAIIFSLVECHVPNEMEIRRIMNTWAQIWGRNDSVLTKGLSDGWNIFFIVSLHKFSFVLRKITQKSLVIIASVLSHFYSFTYFDHNHPTYPEAKLWWPPLCWWDSWKPTNSMCSLGEKNLQSLCTWE